MLTQTDALGNVTSLSYDANTADLTDMTIPGQGTTSYAYDAEGNLISLTGPEGTIATYTYDNNGDELSETDPNGVTTSYTYDSNGNQTEQQLQLGQSDAILPTSFSQ